MNVFNNIFSDSEFVHVPDVIDKLSTNRLLTMSWLEGQSILKYKNAKKEIRNIGKILILIKNINTIL